MLLKDKWVNDEIKEEIRKYLKTDDNKNTTLQQSMENSKISSKGGVHSDTGLPQETNKQNLKQPNLPPKRARKRRIIKTQSQQKEGNNKD